MTHLHHSASLVPSGSFADPFKELEVSNEGFDDLSHLTMKDRTTIDDFQALIGSINPQGSNPECPTEVATPGINLQQLVIDDEELRQLLTDVRDCDLEDADFEELLREFQKEWNSEEPGGISYDNESGSDWFDKALHLLLPDISQEPNTFDAGDDDLFGISTAQPADDPPGLTSSSRTGRRRRSRNWTLEEKDAYLKVKVEGLRCVKGKDWDFISKTLATRYKIDISSKSCEDLWGTLRKSYKRIRDHESMCRNSVGRNSYFMMEEEERIAHKLPKSFPFEWCKMMERILKARGKLPTDERKWEENESTNSQIDLLNSNSTAMARKKLKSYLQKVFMDALQPIASLLQCREKEEQEYEAKLQTIAKKRRALDLEEMQLKRQRAGQLPRTRSKCRTK